MMRHGWTVRGPWRLSAAMLLAMLACNDSSGPDGPTREQIVITDELHHLGDNTGAEGTAYTAQFQVAGAFDSATVSISLLHPNSLGVSGPEIDNPPQIALNGTTLGLAASDFPANAACISGTGPGREYSCNITFTLATMGALTTGQNTIRVASEADTGGDDDFVFTNLIVSVWR